MISKHLLSSLLSDWGRRRQGILLTPRDHPVLPVALAFLLIGCENALQLLFLRGQLGRAH